MVKRHSVSVNGHEVSEGDSINRLGSVRAGVGDLSEWVLDLVGYRGGHRFDENPDGLIQELAEAIVEKVPDQVGTEDAGEVASRIKSDPSYLDEVNGLNFHTMEVSHVTPSRTDEQVDKITLHDWKTEERVTVEAESLSKHLGKTVFVTN